MANAWPGAWISKPLSRSCSAARSGVCGGLGGSMHLTDIDRGLIGAFGIVGAGLPVAVGAGLSAQLAGRKQVSVCFSATGPSISAPFTRL